MITICHKLQFPALLKMIYMSAFKCQKNKLYATGDPQERPQQAKLLKARHAKFNPKNVIFSYEKIFTTEEKFNSQELCIYVVTTRPINTDHFYVSHSKKPALVMVSAAISGRGFCDLKFVDLGV